VTFLFIYLFFLGPT